MDDKLATQFFESQSTVGLSHEHDPSLPRYLIVQNGGMPGTMVALSPGLLWLGRSEENGLSLPEASVSRRHAGLRIDEYGHAWLSDQRSTNGTFRNGKRLPPFEPIPIHDGDRIRLGTKVVLKYACPDPEEEQFQKQMFERTVRDPLTGLYNRSYFLDQLSVLSARAGSRGLGMAVLMLDIDHFKSINDALGHDGGDAVLRDVAGQIRQSARAEDIVARYGGEEFALALPIGSSDQAYDRAETIRTTLAQRKLKFGRRSICVTASLGLSFSPLRPTQRIDALITAADRALYLAKNAGRNRVVRSTEGQFDTPMTLAVAE
ncbi:MAG: pleD 2 [Planctomycetota bacterium]|nr:pleD 2 [Planctomycetota bacterium]